MHQLHPRKLVLLDQMVLLDIENHQMKFSESSCEYQNLRCRVGDPSLEMGCISTVDLLECDEEVVDEVRGNTHLVVILHIYFD